LTGTTPFAGELFATYGPRSAAPLLASANRDPGKLTTVILTGVTALVRGTAVMMELKGMDYPAQDIGPILRQADILHINNEVPFAKNCPAPYPWPGLVFCSQERYIQLLETVGTDVVELAGDHFADWGPDAMHFTLDLYRQRGWPVYGGGENIDQAKQPLYLENNGNKIAFIGCNYKAVGYATASKTNPGAVHCDPAWLYPAIRAAKAKGYLPIVTFQHEEYYEYIARPKLQTDFRGVAQAGAIIVSGSQAHQPHAFELQPDAFLHYGLGNLFFDQFGTDEATRWGFLDRHVIYNGKHIGTEEISIVFVDLARARLATPDERHRMLEKVFTASGW
jgi:poly-gamma-glutamate synthesis protein (capsule biosynthesis protein)